MSRETADDTAAKMSLSSASAVYNGTGQDVVTVETVWMTTKVAQGHGGAKHWHALVLGVFVMTGIAGNLLVCLAVKVERKLQNVTNFFLVSLAVADLLVSVIVMPCAIINNIHGYWPLGFIVCDIWQATDVMLCTSSIWHMCTISIDRYFGIRYPLRAVSVSRKTCKVGMKIGLVWCVSVVITSPLIVIGFVRPQDIMNTSDMQCAVTNNDFLIYGSLSAFFLPLVVMVIAYVASVRLLRQQARSLESNGIRSPGGSSRDLHSGNGLRRSRSGRKPSEEDAPSPRKRSRQPTGYGMSANMELGSAGSVNGERIRENSEIVDTSGLNESGDARPTCSLMELEKKSYSPTADVYSGGSKLTTDNAGTEGFLKRGYSVMRRCESEDTPTSPDHMGVKGNPNSGDLQIGAKTDSPSVQGARPFGSFRKFSVADRSPRKWSTPRTTGGYPKTGRLKSLILQHSVSLRLAGELRRQLASTRVKTESKAARVLGVMFALFVACWAPFFVLNLTVGACSDSCRESLLGPGGIGNSLYAAFLWLGYVASTLNPFVYTAFNGTFRRTFADLILLRRCRRRKPEPRLQRRTGTWK